MRLVKLKNLNEMWELKESYGNDFIGVLHQSMFYVINNGNIINIQDVEKVAKMLKMTSLEQLRLVIAALYFETGESVSESSEKSKKENKKENGK